MIDLNTQIAEFTCPFPSKIFEAELERQNIKFRQMKKASYEGGSDSCVYYVNHSDVEEALEIKEKVNKENAISELKYVHPIRKIFAYFSLVVIVVYLLYRVYELLV